MHCIAVTAQTKLSLLLCGLKSAQPDGSTNKCADTAHEGVTMATSRLFIRSIKSVRACQHQHFCVGPLKCPPSLSLHSSVSSLASAASWTQPDKGRSFWHQDASWHAHLSSSDNRKRQASLQVWVVTRLLPSSLHQVSASSCILGWQQRKTQRQDHAVGIITSQKNCAAVPTFPFFLFEWEEFRFFFFLKLEA